MQTAKNIVVVLAIILVLVAAVMWSMVVLGLASDQATKDALLKFASVTGIAAVAAGAIAGLIHVGKTK
jgi:hypothetical protein